ncbi:MAG: putative amino acid permease, GabP family [Cytophagales bacterium]|nr:amino acid permease [Bacteroidota bacterium]MBS1980443.1 amino acid permease [Bacteroidota bacterium]WHZ07758.1 MAG: putative amino acid permease, GabP family [Cytophagales bacterium]
MNKSPQGQLVRTLGLASAFFLVISSVIGSGVYKKVAPMAEALQSPGLVLLAWLLGGLLTLIGTLSNAEVASMLADSGGEFVYYKKIFNRFFAFLYGWANFTAIRTASVASIAYVFGQSFNSLVTLPHLSAKWESITVLGFLTPFDNLGVKLLTIALIAVLSYINYIGLKIGEEFSKSILYIVLVSILGIILLGLFSGVGSWQNIQSHGSNYVERSWTDPIFISAMFTALLSAFWGYEGWSTIGYLGGEIKDAQRNLPLALVFGMIAIMVIYLLTNFAYLYVLPIDQLIGHSGNSIAAVTVIEHILGPVGGIFISLLILLTTLGCTNTTILASPRLFYAMAKEGLFFKSAQEVHPQHHTPTKALIFQGVWSGVLVMSGSFDQLTDMLIFASFIFYGSTALGVFVLRIKMPDAPRPYKAWGYPVLPALFILFCIVLLVVSFISKPREALMGLTLMASGVPFYFYWKDRKPVSH